MAIVSLLTPFEIGQQSQSQLVLGNLLWIMDLTTFPNPFAISDVKAALEAGQPSTWTTEAFNQYLQELYDYPLDTTALSVDEKSRLNLIREQINPPPSFTGCSTPGDTPMIANTTAELITNVGSVTFEHELQIQFDTDVTCDVFEVEVTNITPGGGAPAVTTGIPFSIFLKEYDSNIDKAVYSKFWLEFAADPSGFGYTFDIDVKDSSGASLNTYSEAATAP